MSTKIKTKIVCTIGPSSWSEPVLRRMINSGMTVARVNAAYADVPELRRVAKIIRSISDNVALMLDIKGNDVRLNEFPEPIPLKIGEEIVIGSSERDQIYPQNYKSLYKDLNKGDKIIFDDGNVRTTVSRIKDKKIYLLVNYGKLLKPGKSLNTPGTYLNIPAVTKTDKEQIKFAIKDDWDFVAASYIRDADDVRQVKRYLKGSHLKVISKIEEEMGVKNIDEIIEECEGIMIGRGDMGVEMPFEKIPEIQRTIIEKCNHAGKPVITATEVMASMVENPFPTRAEISDAANAVLQGTDAIMTSGETSTGKFPAETVWTIARIAKEAEKGIEPELVEHQPDAPRFVNALTRAAYEVCICEKIAAVIIVTETGRTSRILGRHRIKQPIYAFVAEPCYKRRLLLSKGVSEVFVYDKNYKDRDAALKAIIKQVMARSLVAKNDVILVMGGGLKRGSYFPNVFEIVDLSEFKV
jgi:pyruvate kinase